MLTQPSFIPLQTPAEYEEMLLNVDVNAISIIKYGSPYCRSCKKPSPLLESYMEAWPDATVYSMQLIRDGKAAGKRMLRFFKERQVLVMPYLEVYRGSECIKAGSDRELALESCIVTRTAVSCAEVDLESGSMRGALHALKLDS